MNIGNISQKKFQDTPYLEMIIRPPFCESATFTITPVKDKDNEWVKKIWIVMMENKQHTFQILTKRPERMRQFLEEYAPVPAMTGYEYGKGFLPKNIWIGVTAENQKEADTRIPTLIDLPAAKKFVSIEPMLEEINLKKLHRKMVGDKPAYPCSESYLFDLDWVIVGGETGAKSKTREISPDWVRKVYNDCVDSNTSFFFKQWGTHKPNYKCEFENVKEFPV